MKSNGLKKCLCLYLPLAVMMIFILFPYFWMILTSFRPEEEIISKVFRFFPTRFDGSHYITLFTQTSYGKGILNSFMVAIATVFFSLIICMISAYSFSRFQFKGKSFLVMLYLVIYLFPSVLLMIPLFSIMKALGILNSLWSLVIAYCTFTIPLSTWMMIDFLNEIPITLEEAAMVDGCNRFVSFIKIILPMAVPGAVATGTYVFIYAWNEFTYAVMFTNETTMTLPVAIYRFVGEFNIRWDLLCAGGVIACIPVVVLFMFVQKQLIHGLTAGAVKG
jgi:multiple sugar transport system permease protein